MSESIVAGGKSWALAADVQPRKFRPLVEDLEDVPGLSAIKVGFEVGLGSGLRTAVDDVLQVNEKLKIVYDHQKAGNDIPATGVNFARAMRVARVDAAILFSFTGPQTQEKWTRELQERGIGVIQGAEMTHDQIRASEGGYIVDAAFRRMFEKAVELDVTNFVVPGNKRSAVDEYKALFDDALGEGNYTLWSPGLITQGGDVSETGQAAGPNFVGIVGSGVYGSDNPRQAAVELGQKVLSLNETSAG